jgi:hypothetical protein
MWLDQEVFKSEYAHTTFDTGGNDIKLGHRTSHYGKKVLRDMQSRAK